jgi:exopolyphosphatase/guanosine-5'-triphosphate,3'-diphosphate pyrophosphatase
LRDRILLAVASTLHDIGEFVGYAHHHKHGFYLVSNAEIGGLTSEEMRLVAVVVRFHRRAHPSDRHPEFALLSRDDRRRASRLAAILRVADSLDREHRQKVGPVAAAVRRGELCLASRVQGDAALEAWSLDNKGALFKEAFGMPVRWDLTESKRPETAPAPAPSARAGAARAGRDVL